MPKQNVKGNLLKRIIENQMPLKLLGVNFKDMDMDDQVETIEARLQSFLGQLQSELGVLDRIIHKNKNQHRRSSYFQYSLKVRRDFKLLQSTNLLELVNSSFIVINGNRPRQKVHLLESLKKRKCDGGKHSFLDRLLGATRLLSQMVEPMLKAAIELSTLLARSFFMGFSMTLLALLARLRVLTQQILLDVVSVFNMASALSRKRQSIKLNKEGIEVYREYYPTNEQTNEELVFLECVWETDKFMLLEKTIEPENTNPETVNYNVIVCQGSSAVEYKRIETILGVVDNKPADVTVNKTCEEDPATMRTDNVSSMEGYVNDDCKRVEDDVKDDSGALEPSVKGPEQEHTTCSGLLVNQDFPKVKQKKVAFISVKKLEALKGDETGVVNSKLSDDRVNGKKEDSFFSLLTGGI
ncbi:uncharacterized protein LOC143602374 [Bidens hawaiensis]|uniref:uncharacterized protein LOC143602374 n=1 Tax=Bidens hawaiensis TaxID=980011 RepID=UPI00404A7453